MNKYFKLATVFIPFFFLIGGNANAQITKLEENTPVISNNIEYGYVIKNVQQKNIKDDSYSRYEVTIYASNKSGCTKLYADRVPSSITDQVNLLATFDIINANGRRLTAKSVKITVPEFYVTVKVDENGKEITKQTKAGYILRNGESIRTSIIVLVPLGEKPNITVAPNFITEL